MRQIKRRYNIQENENGSWEILDSNIPGRKMEPITDLEIAEFFCDVLNAAHEDGEEEPEYNGMRTKRKRKIPPKVVCCLLDLGYKSQNIVEVTKHENIYVLKMENGDIITFNNESYIS